MEKEYTKELLLDFGKDGNKLIPVVAQDSETREVLILAFTNRAAFEESRKSGFATFWSRSRNELWKKGQTSGDMLKIDDMLINCEQNSLVYLVTPLGSGACHAKCSNGQSHTSCYYRRITKESKLEFIEI